MNKAEESVAVLFDMDGVLLESHGYTTKSFDAVLSEYDLSFESLHDPKGQGFKGSSLKQFLEAIEEQHGIVIEMDNFTERADTMAFRMMLEDGIVADPELIEFLEELTRSGVKIGLGSSSTNERIHKILEILGITTYFTAIVGAYDVTDHKPSPHVYLETAKRLSVPPAQCVVIEDAAAGVEAGKSAGMKVIGYLKYQDQRDSLAEADILVNNFSELNTETIQKLILTK
ncbi:MAG: family hydrolase [Candidatus Saccharibacteria bacterium]|nr:family hydrolase [Candidatus Saccharibacteria bacterium]